MTLGALRDRRCVIVIVIFFRRRMASFTIGLAIVVKISVTPFICTVALRTLTLEVV